MRQKKWGSFLGHCHGMYLSGLRKMAKYCRNQWHFAVTQWLCWLIIQTPKFTEIKSRPTRISSQNGIAHEGTPLFWFSVPTSVVPLSGSSSSLFLVFCQRSVCKLQITHFGMSPKSLKIKSVRLITDRDLMTVYQLLIWHVKIGDGYGESRNRWESRLQKFMFPLYIFRAVG